jgi:hypothetical protein
MLSAWATRPLIKAKPEIVGEVMKRSKIEDFWRAKNLGF